jgi:hypothetical protein
MPHPLLEQRNDVRVIYAVVDFLSISPGFYKVHLHPQVMGYG